MDTFYRCYSHTFIYLQLPTCNSPLCEELYPLLQECIGFSLSPELHVQRPPSAKSKFSSTMALVRPIPDGASAARTRVSPLATGEMTTSDTRTPPQLPHHKVKIKKTGQRACNRSE